MDRFGIVFDKPNYCPGESVTGNVVFQNGKALKARYLKVSIHGAAHTKWSETKSHTRYRDGKQESYTETEHYSSEHKFISKEKILWKPEIDEAKLVPGRHVFTFSFPLPPECPPNFEGEYGHVRYRVKAELDRPWNFNSEDTRDFSVLPKTDLRSLPFALSPIFQRDENNIGVFFIKGVVSMKVTIPKQAYSIGEEIPVTVDIDNTSKRPATSVRAELNQLSHYCAKRDSFFSSSTEHVRNQKYLMTQTRKNIKVAGGTKSSQLLKLKVPRLPPTFNSSIIRVEYCLSVVLETETTLNNTLKCKFSVIIVAPQAPPPAPTAPYAPVVPSAPPEVSRMDSRPPDYDSLLAEQPGPSGLPPSYEESMTVTKV